MQENSVYLFILAALLGIADYTLTRIIIKGSIFEKYRKWVKEPTMSYFWHRPKRLLFEMSSCHLCLGAQLSLWALSLPLHCFAGSPFRFFVSGELGYIGNLIFITGSWFIFGMIVTGVHYYLWDITVDKIAPPVTYNNKDLIEVILTSKQNGNGHSLNKNKKKLLIFEEHDIQIGFSNENITFNEFLLLVFYAQYSCANYRCPITRPQCIGYSVEFFLEGKLMRAMNLPGTGKIPQHIRDYLILKIGEVIDRLITNFRKENAPKMGSEEWILEVENVYNNMGISSIIVDDIATHK